MANVLHTWHGYNTRSCGSIEEFALVPISEALCHWADEIVFVTLNDYKKVTPHEYENWMANKEIKILDIPDNYDWMDEQLQDECLKQYEGVYG